jgi:hypothetical protein
MASRGDPAVSGFWWLFVGVGGVGREKERESERKREAREKKKKKRNLGLCEKGARASSVVVHRRF